MSQLWELYKTGCLSPGLGRNSVCDPGVRLVAASLVPALSSSVVLNALASDAEKKSVFQSLWVLCKLSLGTGSLARSSYWQFCQGFWMRNEFHNSISVLSCSESSPAHLPALGAFALLKLKGQVHFKPEVRWLCKLSSKDAANKHGRRQTKVP